MEIQQLIGFVAVARYGSFSVAAQKTLRTQPAVSLQVQALEEEFRVKLFDRFGPQKVILTEEGKLFFEMLSPLLEQIQSFTERYSEALRRNEHVRVRIATHASVISLILPDPLKEFRRRYPEAEVSIFHEGRPDVLRCLKNGEVDIGITSLSVVPDWLNYEVFYRFNRVLICPKKHPLASRRQISIKNLSGLPFILPPTASMTRVVVDGVFSRAGLGYELALEITGRDAVKTYVQMGWGLSVINEYYLNNEDRRKLAVKDASHLFGFGERGILTHKDRHLSAPVREFMELLKERYIQKAPRQA